MMQKSIPELHVYLKAGQPIAAIPRKSLQYLFDVLRSLKVKNGKLIKDRHRWTIECGTDVQDIHAFAIISYIDQELTIAPGFVTSGLWRVAVPQTTLNVSGSQFFIVMKIMPKKSAEWVCLSSLPANTPTTIYYPVYEFIEQQQEDPDEEEIYETISAGPSLAVIHHRGSIFL